MAATLILLSAMALVLQMSGIADGAATITVPPVNATAQVGSTASFFCGITGTQDNGQYHTFRKVSPTASLIASDSNPSDSTKHNITDTYRLTINDVVVSDEGGYQCDLFPNTYTMFLTVIDAPNDTTLTWGASATTTTPGVAANLTCNVPRSRPVASLRWTRGSTDVTSSAISSTGTADTEGYASAMSILQVTPTVADLGVIYTCFVDLADVQNVTQTTLSVAFSGAPGLQTSLIAAALVLMTAALTV